MVLYRAAFGRRKHGIVFLLIFDIEKTFVVPIVVFHDPRAVDVVQKRSRWFGRVYVPTHQS
jgi:hypothetical protein